MTFKNILVAIVVFISLVSGEVLKGGKKDMMAEVKSSRDAQRLLQTNCVCGGGLDYGCDQRLCGKGASCQAGHCIQDGLDSPSCDGGDCSQANTTDATCEPNNCCPPLSNCDTYPLNGEDDCIGANLHLFSCTRDKYVPAWDLSIGDSVRSMTSDGPVCTEIYYVFKHEAKSTAYTIKVESSSRNDDVFEEIVLSPNHLLYVGNNFSERRAVSSKRLQIGDELVSSNGDGFSQKVISIDLTQSNLVNILTFEPTIQLESGVIISAHSFHDIIYSYVFWPFALAYKYFGIKMTTSSAQTIIEKLQLHTIAKMAVSMLSTISP